MADSLTSLLQPSDGSIRQQIGNTFLILQAGTFKVGNSLLVGTENSTAPATVLIYADTIEMTAQEVDAAGCNIGLFCRAFSLGSFPYVTLKTAGGPGAPVTDPEAPPTPDNNGQDAGNVSIFVEDFDPDKLGPQNFGGVRKGIWISDMGGPGANGVKYGTEGHYNGGVGGNSGQVQVSYVSPISQLVGRVNKTSMDVSIPFRSRAQTLATLLPKTIVAEEASLFETRIKDLFALSLVLGRIKHIFKARVPKPTKASLDSTIGAINTTLRLTTEPRLDQPSYSRTSIDLHQKADSILKTSVEAESKDIPWEDLEKALIAFKTALHEISTLYQHALSPFAASIEEMVKMMNNQIQIVNENLIGYYFWPGGEGGAGREVGTSSEPIIKALSPDSPDLAGGIAYVHPDQCQMLLDLANREYLKASCDTANKSPGRFDEAQKLYETIFRRLSFIPLLQKDLQSQDPQPLTRAYVQMEADQIALNPVEDLAQIRSQAGLYLCNIAHGKDMFGHDGDKDSGARWVPRLQYTQYSEAITKSLPTLYKLVTSIAAQQGTQQNEQYNAQLTATSVQAHMETLQQQIQLDTSSTGPLKAAESQIKQYTPALQAMRGSIESQVTALTDELQTAWNFNPPDIINGITQILSSPDPLNIGMSVFSGLYNSFTTVQGDDGDDVNKQYVIKQFASAGKDLEKLDEAVKMTAGGTYSADDPGATKLIADEKTLKDLLDKFEGALDAGKVKGLKKTLHEFAKLAKTRNAAVLKYNTTAIMLVKAVQDLKFYTNKAAVLSGQQLMSGSQQGSLLLLQLKTFNAMCATTYELIYEASRSMQFWTLCSNGEVAPPLPTSGFNDINTVEQIQAYVEQLSSKFTSWLASYSGNPGLIFPNPNTSSGPTSGGITWFLTQDQVSDLQNNTIQDPSGSTGQQEYQIMFTLPAPTSQSTDTSESPDYNPFTGYANVRLDQLLVWLFGATVQPDQETQQCRLSIEISHLGNDTITKNDGKTNLQFIHGATQLKFVYDPTNVTSWVQAQKTNPITVQNLDSGGEGAGRDSARTERDLSVAPIGPFATWMLTVRERENNGLDLSKLTGICLEFWGSAHTVEGS